jgi:hypothetical protein
LGKVQSGLEPEDWKKTEETATRDKDIEEVRYRSIVLFRKGEKSFFVYGFPKSELGNIRDDEEERFKKMAKHVLALTDAQQGELISSGQFEEVAKDG